MILADNAAEDQNWRILGLTDFAVRPACANSALIPLVASGRMQGYLQLSHRANPGPLSDSDLRLLQIVSDQLAAIIENARLVDESRTRIERSEAMARLTEVTATAATVDEVLQRGLKELARCSRQQPRGLLFDESRGELRLHGHRPLGRPTEWRGAPRAHAG